MTSKTKAFQWAEEVIALAEANGWEKFEDRDNIRALSSRVIGFKRADALRDLRWLTVIVYYDSDGKRSMRSAFQTDQAGNRKVLIRDVRSVLKSIY